MTKSPSPVDQPGPRQTKAFAANQERSRNRMLWGESATPQFSLHECPPLRQPTRYRPYLPTEYPSGIRLALTAQAAEGERNAVFLRQALDGRVEESLQFVEFRCGERLGRLATLVAFLMVLSPHPSLPDIRGFAISDTTQPLTKNPLYRERRRFPHQHEEAGLASILRVLPMAQHSPAHSQHHLPVPGNESRRKPRHHGRRESTLVIRRRFVLGIRACHPVPRRGISPLAALRS